MRRYRRLWWFLAILLVLPSGVVHAQAPPKEEAFVYGVNAAAPDGVIGTFAPPAVETIYLLADQTSVLSPRRTLVYFWPITNEYRAAWSEMNEVVEGTLEISQGGRRMATLEQETYTIHFYTGERAPRPTLYLGDEAVAANQQFEAEREAYRRAVYDYQERYREWQEQLRELQARRESGENVEVPPPPEQPEPLDLFSTGLNRGYPISLPPGEYDIHLRLPDGSIQPGSARHLVVFAARRTAVGYTVIPESRWTTPEELADLSDIILGTSGTLYLQPHVIREYPALAYEYLLNPQYPGDARGTEWRWVLGEPIDEGTMEVIRNGEVVERVTLAPFQVKQVPGATLGYEILPYRPDEPNAPRRPDFVAYRISLSEDASAYEVRLVSPEGRILAGSLRQVRHLPQTDLRLFLTLPLVPLVLGALVIERRRRQTMKLRAAAA